MGLCVVSVLSVMILCCGLVSLCLCVYDLKLCGSLCVVSVLHCVRLALCVVLSRFSNAIDNGTGKPGAVAGLPGAAPPGGGQSTGEGAAGSGLNIRKTEKDLRNILTVRNICVIIYSNRRRYRHEGNRST